MIDILLVDDHDIVRAGLKALLEESGQFHVVADVANVAEAIQCCRQTTPEVVLMDLSLPGQNGIEGTEETLRACPAAKVVVLSAFDDDRSVTDAIRAGARGFVVKRASRGDLFDAIRAVASGGVYLSPDVSHTLISHLAGGPSRSSGRDIPALTPREKQVLRLIAEGKSSKEIAADMGLSPETIRSYRKALMKKLGIHNVAGLTQLAISTGMVDRFETDPSAATKQGV